MKRNRKGFTLPELLTVIAIIALVSAVLAKFLPGQVADMWLSKGASGVQAEILTARAAALSGYRGQQERVVGFRLLPDPQWPLTRIFDGTIARTASIAYARTVPLVEAAQHRSGLASVHTDFYPPGFVPPPGRLVLEESYLDAEGQRAEPTSWFWNIRVGDVVTMNGHDYTVCGPTLIPFGPSNPDGFVNWGWPGAASPLVRTFVVPNSKPVKTVDAPLEWLYLTNRLDDDGDGYTDSGWDGMDNDLDGYTDELDEWELERWANVPAEGLASAPYEVTRLPVPLDRRSGGDVANLKMLPSPVIVDGLKSVLPINPFTGAVDVVWDAAGTPSSPSPYGKPIALPLGSNSLCFWITARDDVTAAPDPSRGAKVVSLDLRSGVVRVDDGDPMDVIGTLSRLEAAR
jgi:prepilin-type N-terminal cleavage/methylation domain-containing protein